MNSASFEEQLKKHERDKLAKDITVEDKKGGVPLGTQLEFYAHPNHYKGCNFNTISHMVYLKQNVPAPEDSIERGLEMSRVYQHSRISQGKGRTRNVRGDLDELHKAGVNMPLQQIEKVSTSNRRDEIGSTLRRTKSTAGETDDETQKQNVNFPGENSNGLMIDREGVIGLGGIKSTTFGPGDNFGKTISGEGLPMHTLTNQRSKSFGNKRELLRNKYNFSQGERFPKKADTGVIKAKIDVKDHNFTGFPPFTQEDRKMQPIPEILRYTPGFESDSSNPRSPSRRISRRNIRRKLKQTTPPPADQEQEENGEKANEELVNENVRDGRLSKGKSLFRRTIRIILHLQQWISAIMEKGEEESEGAEKTSSFSDFAQALNTQRMANSDIHFDPADFKAKKDINISKDVQYILSLPKAMRTSEQVQSVLYGLQHLRSFAEYPLHMQEKLCKVAFFQTVTPKRVIIRQGHYAENFYFILSGHAMVTLLERDPVTGETQLRAVKSLKKGQSFGELALLHHNLRNATVVSQDTVQLLTIGRDDFFDIFMGQSASTGELPEHLKFISQLEFARDFPMEKILENPEVCLLHFFKRGEVIVQDSSKSDWIYIIKSGTCQVMKELHSTQELKLHKRSKTLDDLTMRLPKLGTAEQAPKVFTGRKRHRSYTMPTELRRAMTQYEDSLRLTGGRLPALEEKPLVSVDPSSREGVERPVPGRTPGYSRSKLGRFPEQKKSAHFSPSPSPELKTPKRATPQPQEPLQVNQWSTLLNILKSETPKETVRAQRRKSEPPKAHPVYVQVDLLKPRDIFGLNTVKFDLEMEVPNTKVSLVSRGAECVMLAKSFFARNANEKVKHVVRNLARPYPSEDALQKNLQMKEDWANFKKDLIQDIVSRPNAKKLQ